MNSLDSLNAITRRALRVNYQSPAVCLPDADVTSSGSGSSGSSTLDFAPVYRKDGPTSLELTLVDGPDVVVEWSEVATAYVYIVYTATSAEGPWTVVAAGVSGLSFLAESVSSGEVFFKVTAIEPSAGETYPSPIVSVTVP